MTAGRGKERRRKTDPRASLPGRHPQGDPFRGLFARCRG